MSPILATSLLVKTAIFPLYPPGESASGPIPAAARPIDSAKRIKGNRKSCLLSVVSRTSEFLSHPVINDFFVIRIALILQKEPAGPIPLQTRLKEADSISHDDFIVGYQNGRLGCSVHVLRVSLLVYSGSIREKRIVANVVGWSVWLLVLVCLWMVGLCFLPLLWALLAGGIVLASFALVCLQRLGEAILSVALTDPDFYHLVRSARALGLAVEKEGHLSRLHKVVPMRPPRQARRR